jgi:PBP1b-binding outer membrane lipoprotein LpoB
MKKVFLVLILALLLAGCTTEWYQHDTIYKNHDHMFFSWWGYQNPTAEDMSNSETQGWWGDGIPYIPAE